MLNRKFNSNLTIALKESYFKNLKYLNRLTFLTRITKIMTAQFTMATAFTLLGGLAIFLFGMNMMSDNIQKVAGEKMRAILGMLTKNPVFGVIAGALATSVLQSSSATTVMAIGFVSAGLMRLPQAISIIFGANIGTTMTAQLIAFKLSNYIYLIIAAGFLVYFLTKTDKSKSIGLTILSFGLLFLGIETMGHVMKPFASHPGFTEMISNVKDIPYLGVVVGTVMTIIVQSSSATIAVLQNFAAQPDATGHSVLGLQGALPILLGDNIGTTITALLACIGQSRDAKRTAVAHSIFNISGSLLFLCILPLFAKAVEAISPTGPDTEIISRQIANAHTLFNISMTIIWTPLIFLMVKIVMCIIPEKKVKGVQIPEAENVKVLYLDNNIINQPTAAMVLIAKETMHISQVTEKMIGELSEVVKTPDDSKVEEITQKANGVRNLYNKINDYIAKVFARGGFTESQAEQTAALTSIICEIDRAASLSAHVAKLTTSENIVDGKKLDLSDEARMDLNDASSKIKDLFKVTITALKDSNADKTEEIIEKRSSILELDFKMRKSHMKRVASGECKSEVTKVYNRILHDLNRMEISCVNIADMSRASINFKHFLSITQEGEAPKK